MGIESIIAGIVIGLFEALIFKWAWWKRHVPLRNAVKAMVTSIKGQAATAVANRVKRTLDKNPRARKVLDEVISEAHANVPN